MWWITKLLNVSTALWHICFISKVQCWMNSVCSMSSTTFATTAKLSQLSKNDMVMTCDLPKCEQVLWNMQKLYIYFQNFWKILWYWHAHRLSFWHEKKSAPLVFVGIETKPTGLAFLGHQQAKRRLVYWNTVLHTILHLPKSDEGR